jgi:uncharacterized membrane protein
MRVICLAAVVLGWVAGASAQGTYTQIDYPGAQWTIATAIDSLGDIIGYWLDLDCTEEGFLLRGGTYSPIVYPGAFETKLNGINDQSQIVGFNGVSGFVYDLDTKQFSTYQGADKTDPLAINNSGVIVGNFVPPSIRGFVLSDSGLTTITLPNGRFTEVTGISSAGRAVGVADVKGSGATESFSFAAGKLHHLSVPGLPGAGALDISPSGTAIAGSYPVGFVHTGFLYQNGQVTKLEVPGADSTYPAGVNDAGQVVGSYVVRGITHAFTWTPPNEAH